MFIGPNTKACGELVWLLVVSGFTQGEMYRPGNYSQVELSKHPAHWHSTDSRGNQVVISLGGELH